MSSISTSEYAQRRQHLMQSMTPNSIAILPAAPVSTRNSSVEYPYRQDSDFFYLSGFSEPEAVLVLIPQREQGPFVMFCRERNPERELWDGLRAGQAGVIADYHADDAFPISEIDDILPKLMDGCERVYYAIGNNPEFDQNMSKWLTILRSQARMGAQPPTEFVMLDPLVHEARLHKSPAEIATMQQAADISCRAHIRAMQAAKAGLYEYHLEAELDYEFRKGGARLAAYSSIVASGKNACILHYTENNAPLHNGDLVLIDAGCEIDCYASDITRTFPVSVRFSPEQRAIYTIVLKANLEALNYISPQHCWNDAHDATVRVITAGLLELGLLQGELDELIANHAYRPFYMHRAGHWLGLDVHDVGEYKINGQWRTLAAGMTMTVEPGIYIAVDNLTVPEQWRGIGVRIEDDVVVTEDGCRVLTNAVPKTIAEIEHLMAAAQQAGA